MHTGQHYDDSLSRVFFASSASPRPDRELGIGGGTNTSQTARMLAALEPLLAEAATRRGARLRRHQLDARGRARGGAGARARRARRGGHALVRPHDARGAQPGAHRPPRRAACCAPRRRRRRTCGPSRCRAVQVVGDVMVDVALRRQPAAPRGRRGARAPTALEAGAYLLLTAHRAGNVDGPERLRALVELIEALPGPVLFPLHPRTRERLRTPSLLAAPARVPGLRRDRATRLRRVQRAALPGARGR